MDKLQMAHEHMQNTLKFLHENSINYEFQKIVDESFDYADAMMAEYEKRNNPQPVITDQDKQHIEQAYSNILKPPIVEEWQPDWSQAPGRMNWFSIDKDGTAAWYVNKPTISATEWVVNFSDRCSDCYMHTSNFGYTGNWQDSLRKRPTNI